MTVSHNNNLCFILFITAESVSIGVPRLNTTWQENTLKTTFSKIRNHENNNNGKQAARQFISDHFRHLGLTVDTQSFPTERNGVSK